MTYLRVFPHPARSDYGERQKKFGIVCPAFLREIRRTPLYERGARGDFVGGFLDGADWPSHVNFFSTSMEPISSWPLSKIGRLDVNSILSHPVKCLITPRKRPKQMVDADLKALR